MPHNLKNHFLQHRFEPEPRTDQQICQGPGQDIAYGKLLNLLEKHELVALVKMIDGNPHLDRPLRTQQLGRRTQTACKFFAEEQGMSLRQFRETLNVARRANGLTDLAASYVWENGKVPQDLRRKSGRKRGSLAEAHARTYAAGREAKQQQQRTNESRREETRSLSKSALSAESGRESEGTDDGENDDSDLNDDLDVMMDELEDGPLEFEDSDDASKLADTSAK